MIEERSKLLILGAVILTLALIVTGIFSGVFTAADNAMLSFEYRVRGESAPDSSVVVLYFDNDDIASLGGLPLKRSYYALLVNVLHELHATAVGIDIAFTERSREYEEYDRLLAAVVKNSGNVILGGYFRSIDNDHLSSGSNVLPDRFKYPLPLNLQFEAGNQLEVPYPELLDATAAFGHTNLTDNLNLPLFVHDGGNLVPSFPLEVVRVAIHAERRDVAIGNDGLEVRAPDKKVKVPFDDCAITSVHFTGGFGTLRSYSALRFLKAYDSLKAGNSPSIPIQDIEGHIVLVGVIAEGRSTFVPTPFSYQFPALGLHAMAIENMLNGSFLRRLSPMAEYVIALVIGAFCIFLMNIKRELNGLVFIILTNVLLVAVSVIIFIEASWYVPVARVLFASLIVTVCILVVRHRLAGGKINELSLEKEKIVKALEEKERSLRMLEQRLTRDRQARAGAETVRLREEIEKYKREISSLKTRAEDYNVFDTTTAEVKESFTECDGIVYHSSGPMADVVNFIKKIAGSDAAVLLLGESGTGKELVARSIHRNSNRRERSFIAVNCGAIAETLLESELFGHEKGSFTGAVKEKAGRFELADGGTIFLDEVAETSEAFQVKLLRVLQEGTFERVGGTDTRQVNVRVIAATNRDIKQAVAEKKFREDLFYRLNVFTVQLPPLRERRMDIPLLANTFVESEEAGLTVSSTVMSILQNYSWKGNVRELQSAMKRAVLLAKSEGRTMLRVKDLPVDIIEASESSVDIEEQILELMRAKQFARNAISETADELGGLNRGTVAEYFRGCCFKIFVEKHWHFPSTIEAIALSTDPVVIERVRKKIFEYMVNAVESVDTSVSDSEVLVKSKPKYKNLPQRYHPFLDDIIISFHKGEWKLDDLSLPNLYKNA